LEKHRQEWFVPHELGKKYAGLIVFVEPLWPSSFGFGKQKFDE